MSHWSKAKTKITEQQYVEGALTRMGYEFETGEFKISAYGTSETAQIRLHEKVGLSKQEDGTWAMVGDPYYVNRDGRNGKLRSFYQKVDKFGAELSNQYAIDQAHDILEDQSFECVETEETEEEYILTFQG